MATRTLEARGAGGTDLGRMGVLPVMALGALSGIVGVTWDIAWHIDKGRDSFFTPPHNFIYAAMLLTLAVAAWALARDRRATPLHLPVGRARLHPGALIVAFGAVLVLAFAPADELWHRLFGADVSLWAPMHLIGLTGLILLAFGGLVAAWVERQLAPPARRVRFERATVLFGALLLGWMMLLLAEYEFNLPAYPMAWHPLLLAALPPLALLLLARLRPVPWAATWAAVLFTLLRLALAGGLMLTARFDLAGQSRPLIPVLLLAAVAADLLARRAPAWLAGLAVGALALLATAPIVAFGPVNWHPRALAWGVPAGLVLAAASGVLGARIAAALRPREAA